jgi:hypothetical protein
MSPPRPNTLPPRKRPRPKAVTTASIPNGPEPKGRFFVAAGLQPRGKPALFSWNGRRVGICCAGPFGERTLSGTTLSQRTERLGGKSRRFAPARIQPLRRGGVYPRPLIARCWKIDSVRVFQNPLVGPALASDRTRADTGRHGMRD